MANTHGGTITTSGGTYTYAPSLAGFTPLIFNGNGSAITNSVTTGGVLSVLTTYQITSEAGAVTAVHEGIGALSIDDLTANGGSMTVDSTLSTLGVNNFTIENGGSITANASFIGLLSGSTVDFGGGSGNVFHITNSPSVSLLVGTPTIENFVDGGGDSILDDQITTANIAKYSITNVYNLGGTETGQFITFTSASGATLGTLDFAAGTFTGGSNTSPTQTFNVGAGPLDIDTTSGTLDFTRCFLTGTHIQTPAGEVLIEAMKIGDEVVTADGKIRPVRWIGINTVTTKSADPLLFAPIRIKAGALGKNLPHRDLLVSPDHAMYLNGCLIQAGAMVNGLSITRETNLPSTIKYYHIELENHCLVLAEGAPSETFVDNVDRMGFDNWDEYQALGIQDSIPEMDYPRAQSARQVPSAIRAHLSETAHRLFGENMAIAA